MKHEVKASVNVNQHVNSAHQRTHYSISKCQPNSKLIQSNNQIVNASVTVSKLIDLTLTSTPMYPQPSDNLSIQHINQ